VSKQQHTTCSGRLKTSFPANFWHCVHICKSGRGPTNSAFFYPTPLRGTKLYKQNAKSSGKTELRTLVRLPHFSYILKEIRLCASHTNVKESLESRSQHMHQPTIRSILDKQASHFSISVWCSKLSTHPIKKVLSKRKRQ